MINKFIFSLLIFIISLNLISSSQHQNILISNLNEPEEPTIAINPYNTNQIVAGANINNLYFSNDGGLSWQISTLSSQYGVWGDPCVIVDTAGDYYFFHLANLVPQGGNWIDRIVCQKSSDGGLTWTDGNYMGLNGARAQDKEWATVDRNTNSIFVTWTEFDMYGSSAIEDSSRILFSLSHDGGASWLDPPIKINQISGDCVDGDNTVEGAVPAIGQNGEIFVAWVGPAGIVFDRSLDTGATWLENDIFISDIPGGWDFSVPGISRCNGLPVTLCDTSGGQFHGNIYVNWSDQRNGADNTDIWLTKSIDGGNTWSQATKINDDTTTSHQFFTWMAIDQTNGNLYFVFYDRRNYSDTQTDVYMAFSSDGGNSFVNFKVSESPFIPNQGVFFGDYTNISAHNNVIRPIWTSLDNQQLSIWTAIVDLDTIVSGISENSKFSLQQNFPNPFRQETFFSFKLTKPSVVSLKVHDILGHEIATIVDNKNYNTGFYIESFNSESYSLAKGIYYFSLISNQKTIRKKMIVQ
ncbi:MAG: T9SS type A sorting domain-containing protein [Bacteroidetes bacterium]|jgi:hypothetical protein|nr:T9SS type A sorting domain-containing protein [Bacteroidota bacterium]MBT7143108.1 T9SS type A sorting domain-containing protein [Bacteroidota bacterium]MBT7491479.1 T9SS type A sorting domain-containing protein [Bacteroidota bacterium]